MTHIIVAEECAVCGACEAECPVGAITPHESYQFYIIDPDICTDCEACVDVCPTEAVKPG